MKKTILFLLLIPTTFLAMDQAEQKQEIPYSWAQNPTITRSGRWAKVRWPSYKVTMNVAHATIADFKRAIGQQRENNKFDLRIYFSKDEAPLSEAEIEKIKSLLPNCEVSPIKLYCIYRHTKPIIDPNRVHITCEDGTTLKTVMGVGDALAAFGISQPAFRAVPK